MITDPYNRVATRPWLAFQAKANRPRADSLKIVTLDQAKHFAVWVHLCVFRLLNWDKLLSDQEQAKRTYPVWVIMSIWVSRLEECFHTRR